MSEIKIDCLKFKRFTPPRASLYHVPDSKEENGVASFGLEHEIVHAQDIRDKISTTDSIMLLQQQK